MGIAIAVLVIIVILILGNYSMNFIRGQKGERVLGLKDHTSRVLGIDEVKKQLKNIVHEEYELVELTSDELLTADEGCTQLFKIYPQKYSETQRKYLSSARLIFCEDIYKAVFRSQLEENKYDSERDAWMQIYKEKGKEYVTSYSEQRYYGDNLVSILSRWGSDYTGDLYVVRLENSKELVVLSIPQSDRIRCEEYDNEGTETWNEECVELLATMGIHDAGNGWVPDGLYENYYKELKAILKDI